PEEYSPPPHHDHQVSKLTAEAERTMHPPRGGIVELPKPLVQSRRNCSPSSMPWVNRVGQSGRLTVGPRAGRTAARAVRPAAPAIDLSKAAMYPQPPRRNHPSG